MAMKYEKEILLKNGKRCLLRSGREEDGAAVLQAFKQAHAETDFLLSYPDESTFDEVMEAEFLKTVEASERAAEIAAFVDGRAVGTAGINPVGSREKVRHRASLGISVSKEFWGLGIGRGLMAACIECAEAAGYVQLELDVVATNERAVALYQSMGFEEYGRNPYGMRSRVTGWQEMILMRKRLGN